jgi:aerobic-type carbon monoxide dehydrogenase small subunit (CoxS/CutS family)
MLTVAHCQTEGPMELTIRFTLNRRPVTVRADGERTLLSVLRSDFELTGAKYGCGVGLCGACTVSVGGHPVRTCTLPMTAVAGQDVLTVEGLANGDALHPLQQAFIDHGAVQCGYCTPGMLMAAQALLSTSGTPSRAAIVARMDHNLCRCGAHQRIVQAIEAAARAMEKRS